MPPRRIFGKHQGGTGTYPSPKKSASPVRLDLDRDPEILPLACGRALTGDQSRDVVGELLSLLDPEGAGARGVKAQVRRGLADRPEHLRG